MVRIRGREILLQGRSVLLKRKDSIFDQEGFLKQLKEIHNSLGTNKAKTVSRKFSSVGTFLYHTTAISNLTGIATEKSQWIR